MTNHMKSGKIRTGHFAKTYPKRHGLGQFDGRYRKWHGICGTVALGRRLAYEHAIFGGYKILQIYSARSIG